MAIDISQGVYRAVLTLAATANRVLTFPDATGTVLVAGASNTSVIAPAIKDLAGDVTTSGTTEADVTTVTLTNPPFAGRIFAVGTVSMRNGSVAADNFQIRLYFGGVQLSTAVVQTQTDANGELAVTLVGSAAIAASGTQILKTTIQRAAGTGTVIAAAGQCALGWFIFPGASAVQ